MGWVPFARPISPPSCELVYVPLSFLRIFSYEILNFPFFARELCPSNGFYPEDWCAVSEPWTSRTSKDFSEVEKSKECGHRSVQRLIDVAILLKGASSFSVGRPRGLVRTVLSPSVVYSRGDSSEPGSR